MAQFLYFGYGSNMLLKKLQNDGSDGGCKRCPHAEYKCNCWVKNYEFSFGKNAKASFFFVSNNEFIFFIAFLNLLFLVLLTVVCLEILLILLIADFVFAIGQVI